MGGLLPSGLHVNKQVLGVLVTLVLLFFFVYRGYTWFGMEGDEDTVPPGFEGVVDPARLGAVEELTKEIEKQIDRESKEVDVIIGEVTVKIHVEQAVKRGKSPRLDVLLLHGAKFSSQNWLEIKTPEHIANWGYRAVAIDLPGRGKSPDAIDKSLYGDFLGSLISTLKLTNIVIVAPSASGSNALPYLFNDPSTSTERAKGFVPIAPVDTTAYVGKFKESRLQTLIVYGTKDMQAPLILNNLQLLPLHEVSRIEGAGHACYLDDPAAFHKVLFHFLAEVA